MSIAFPNRSRSYDQGSGRIRFVGHDGMFQIPFFVDLAVFPQASSEAGYLNAFDAIVEKIHDVASRAYGRSRRSTYTLTPSDFS